ncbi:hypothetical protein BDV35DRAFT_360107 [Aspergillus flavus]|uniref:Uncharacterized protein n=1 Tax=Aspergillus flavus TaxID=5059 RepID=A0A5N6GV42_ASPFL|nr:hypothetical protein BDV35DRAFT_360107 [Aspergillus flavus]
MQVSSYHKRKSKSSVIILSGPIYMTYTLIQDIPCITGFLSTVGVVGDSDLPPPSKDFAVYKIV